MPICKTVSFAHITRTSDIILDDCKGKVSCCGLIEALLGIGRSIEVGHVCLHLRYNYLFHYVFSLLNIHFEMMCYDFIHGR